MFEKLVETETTEIKRGDVALVDNPVLKGVKTSCMTGHHFGIVCSNTKGNTYGNVVTVAYATGGVSRADLPCNCVIQFYDFLPEPVGTILCNQIATVDKDRIKVVGHLTKEDEIRFNRCLKASLALED